MKYLTVIRHAKSSWAQPGRADHDRPLNERGLSAAGAVASFLHRTYFGGGESQALIPPPDRLMTSTAARALATAKIMQEVMGMTTESLILDSTLYLAEAPKVLNAVRQLDENWRHVVFFGHNPGLHDFAERILARAHVPKMPTCTAVLLALPHAFWGLADWGEAQLIGYVTPKALERRFPELYAGISRTDGED
ncbi:phosphohistidine phosphatase [Prosthecobacter fusiformis]|uniref:Phosphohistidine phosphatase n=1 Tax=Prosthecobacter fusiformis TaxID=48464 RepID=A0A4R7RNY3_9BACT|nr:histidine phosphatase family protein [Prosthecobacter fusiformis]TDU67180.1 phosphohistidine phosphatase [Prosthecobacter fusiformis]